MKWDHEDETVTPTSILDRSSSFEKATQSTCYARTAALLTREDRTELGQQGLDEEQLPRCTAWGLDPSHPDAYSVLLVCGTVCQMEKGRGCG